MKSVQRILPAGTMVLPLFLLVTYLNCPVAHAERIRTVIPRATLNYLSLPVAEMKGFFRDQGLENEAIVIPGTTAIAALVSGNVDYSGAGGSGMRAALRGAPIKAIMFQTEKVTWYLLAAPDIQKISDLKGKRISVGTIGDTQDTLITMLVEREGLSARDITRIAMPSRNTANTILSLKTGAYSATVVNADESLLGEKEGLRTLAFVGDLFPYPFQGFVATDKTIAERPNDIKRWLRAMSRALMFIRDKPEEAADIKALEVDGVFEETGGNQKAAENKERPYRNRTQRHLI